MKNPQLAMAIGLSAVLVVGIFFSASITGNYAQAQSEQRDRLNMQDRVSAVLVDGRRGAALGALSSIQTDPSGSDWIIYGTWSMVVLATPERAQGPDMIFRTGFTMVMTDGNGVHRHQIYDFKLQDWSSGDSTITFVGTATITMRDGPVQDVPVTISILNSKVIEIQVDPEVLDHFGDSPIYGVVLRSTF